MWLPAVEFRFTPVLWVMKTTNFLGKLPPNRLATLIGLTIGFYDGFFGPGTGSFFVFLMVRRLQQLMKNRVAAATGDDKASS